MRRPSVVELTTVAVDPFTVAHDTELSVPLSTYYPNGLLDNAINFDPAGLSVAGALVGVALYALGGARPQTPDLERFLAGERPAWHSPPLLAKIRRRPAPTLVATERAD